MKSIQFSVNDQELELIEQLAEYNHLTRSQIIKHGFFKWASREQNRPNFKAFVKNEYRHGNEGKS
jgi:hypothetical protein